MEKVIHLAQQLIRCPSVTPHDAGCLALIEEYLKPLGFICYRLDQEGVSNLCAIRHRDSEGRHYSFAGHTDVVPALEVSTWTYPPFEAAIAHGKLYGRGAVDMKGAIAAYLAALPALLKKHPKDTFSILLTSDEEGEALWGTQTIVAWLKDKGITPDYCLVGEPTSSHHVGDTLKIGRRGSLSGTLVVKGRAGHVAYPHHAHNPIPCMLGFLSDLPAVLDAGTEAFDPSHFEITSIDVSNPIRNVIPSTITIFFNVRFNPCHTRQSLMTFFETQATQTFTVKSFEHTLSFLNGSEAFLGCSQKKAQRFMDAMHAVISHPIILSTSGGTSDARFLKDLCPVLELGLLNATAHQCDEHVAIQDLCTLQTLYEHFWG